MELCLYLLTKALLFIVQFQRHLKIFLVNTHYFCKLIINNNDKIRLRISKDPDSSGCYIGKIVELLY